MRARAYSLPGEWTGRLPGRRYRWCVLISV